jgi:hypothetical protein
MAIPSYAYLKLKIPGPIGVITVEAKTRWALDGEQGNIELATSVVDLRELSLQVPDAQPSHAPNVWCFQGGRGR